MYLVLTQTQYNYKIQQILELRVALSATLSVITIMILLFQTLKAFTMYICY